MITTNRSSLGASDANAWPWHGIILWIRIWFGAHLLYSGLAYALTGWVPRDMSENAVGAGQFMNSLVDIGLYPIVKYLEILVGLMLVLDLAVPLALVLELPITLVIFFLNVFVEGKARQLYSGPQELFLNASLMFAYGGHYASFLRWKAAPWWLWHGLGARGAHADRLGGSSATGTVGASASPPHAAGPLASTSSASGGLGRVLIVTGILTLIVLVASWALGPPDRKLPPRDYLPLIAAYLMLGLAYWRARPAAQPATAH